MNLSQKRNSLTDMENRLVVVWGNDVMGGVEWEFGVSRPKLLHVG